MNQRNKQKRQSKALSFIAGWIVAVGFYRFGGLGGFGFIAIAILFVSLTDLIWEGGLSHPLASFMNIPFPDLTIPLSMGSTLILLILGLIIIRQVTKRVAIKLD